MRTYIRAKIQGITVTGASVEYFGSVTIDRGLMDAADIDAGEQVHVVNLSTGDRWVTYVLAGAPGEFTLNGGGARLGVVGDKCVLMCFTQTDSAPVAQVVFTSPDNKISTVMTYPGGEQ